MDRVERISLVDEEVIIDEENKIVTVINYDELDPNGEPLMVEYTLDEWNDINN